MCLGCFTPPTGYIYYVFEYFCECPTNYTQLFMMIVLLLRVNVMPQCPIYTVLVFWTFEIHLIQHVSIARINLTNFKVN